MVPHLIEGGLPFRRLVRLHLICAMAGVLLQALPLMGGGLVQGGALAQPDIPFVQTLRPGLMGLRLSTLGDLLVLVGHLALLVNLTVALARVVGAAGWPVLAAALRPEPVEAGR
jgi:cbb3-type cytochrome oxidase subunit 1